MKDQRRKTTIRNLIIFITVVIASGWIGRGLDILMGNPTHDSLGTLLWLIMPLIAALLLRACAGDGWKDIGIKPSFKGNGTWYIIALLIYPVVTTTVLIIGKTLGWITFTDFKLSWFLQAFLVALLPNFFKNIPEEFVWRGYLTPKVHSLNVNDCTLYAIVGLVWGVWHVPYYLFFLDPVIYQSVTTLSLGVFIPLSIVIMFIWGIFFVEMRLLTNSVWPLVLMHMVEDAFVNPLFYGGFIEVVQAKDWLISPLYGVISLILYTAIGLGLRQQRKKRNVLVESENI